MDAGDFEALAAADVRAVHYIILADHVGAELGELGAVGFIGARWNGILLLAHGPAQLVLGHLPAVRTIQRRLVALLRFVIEVALFHIARLNRAARVSKQLNRLNCSRDYLRVALDFL